MSFLGLGGSKIKPPQVTAPPPVPTVTDTSSEDMIKKAKKASGYEKTLLTGSLTPINTGKKKLLGE